MRVASSFELVAFAVCAAVACVGASTSTAQTAVMIADPRIDSVLAVAIRKYAIPAGTAALITSDTIFVGRAGVRRLGDTTTIRLGDRFQIGSNTKAFTAALAAMAIERGLLRWETRPADVFPSIANSIAAGFRDVTLRDLLQMRAGIQRDYWDVSRSVRKGAPVDQRRRLVASVFSAPPAATLGEFKYSNVGYAIVGAMVEAAFHESWDTLVRDSLARPLGIDVHFGWPAHEDQEQPWGHLLVKGKLRPQEPGPFLPPLVDPAGVISLSIGDFARWLQFNLRGLMGADRLIRSTTVHALHTPRGTYAMGWMPVADSVTRRRVDCADVVFGDAGRQTMHEGSAVGSFASNARILPDRGLAVAIMLNAVPPNAASAIEEICKGVLARRAR